MAAIGTTDTIVSRVKRKCQWPSSNAKLTDAQIMQVMDEELIGFIVPAIRRVRENYFLVEVAHTVAASAAYVRVHRRSAMGSVFDVTWQDSTGRLYPLPTLTALERMYMDANATTPTTGQPVAYSLEGDLIRLMPRPDVAGTLRVRFERRPGKMVAVSACGPVTVVGASTLTCTGSTIAASDVVDVVQANPNFDVLIMGATVTSTGTPQVVTFTESLSDVSVGDYICQEDETCIVPIPDIAHMAFIERVAMVALTETGFPAQADALAPSLDARLLAMIDSLTPRKRTDAAQVYQMNSPQRALMRRGGR